MARDIRQLGAPGSDIEIPHQEIVQATLDEIGKRGLTGEDVGPKLACEIAAEFVDDGDTQVAILAGMTVVKVLRERRRNENADYRTRIAEVGTMVDGARRQLHSSMGIAPLRNAHPDSIPPDAA
ncbi:hypothetical protein KKA95_03850 [Patescibacteria group bacterium]|nr:hypothetical protein [Patescibacteria group bacterium]